MMKNAIGGHIKTIDRPFEGEGSFTAFGAQSLDKATVSGRQTYPAWRIRIRRW